MPSDVLSDSEAEITFTTGDKTDSFNLNEIKQQYTLNNRTYYLFSYKLAAKNLADDIAVQITGAGKKSEPYHYSAAEYCSYLESHASSYGDGTVSIARAFLNYGAAAGVYFEHGTDEAGDDYQKAVSAAEQLDTSAFDEYLLETEKCEDIRYTGISLLLRDRVFFRIYFHSSLDSLTASCDGKSLDVKPAASESGEQYYVEISDIPTVKLGGVLQISISGAGQICSISGAPLSYLKKAEHSSDQKLVTLTRCLYLYYKALSDLTDPESSQEEAPLTYLTPQMYGAVADDGGSDTEAFNNAIQDLAVKGLDTLYVPAGRYRIDADERVSLASNMKLILHEDAILHAIGTGSDSYEVLLLNHISNVTIKGGTIDGERYRHFGTEGESGNGIGMFGCSNVEISDMDIFSCWGDGIYIGESYSPRVSSDHVTVRNCKIHDCRRNNISITQATDVLIEDCEIYEANGTDPQFGIDIEPYYSESPAERIIIRNCYIHDNAVRAAGIVTGSYDVLIENCLLKGDLVNFEGYGVRLVNTTVNGHFYSRTGTVLDDSSLLNDGTDKEDVLIARITNFSGMSLYENDSANPASASIGSDGIYTVRRTGSGTHDVGCKYTIGALEQGKYYRFEYDVAGTGNWWFKTNQTAGYFMVPGSNIETLGVTYDCYTSASSCDLIFVTGETTGSEQLRIKEIRVYRVE